jgi:PAS domain S-box-containing protein
MIAGLLVIDTNHKIISVNPAAEKILGLYMHEMKGRNCGNILCYKDHKGNILPLDKWPIFNNLNFGLTYRGEEGFFVMNEEREVPIELTATPHYKDINMVGYIIVFQPVSLNKEA